MKPIIREVALALNVNPRTIQKWKERGRVPYSRQRELAAKAKEMGRKIVWSDMDFPTKKDAA